MLTKLLLTRDRSFSVEFQTHADVSIPSGWHDANDAAGLRRREGVGDQRVAIIVGGEDLKQ